MWWMMLVGCAVIGSPEVDSAEEVADSTNLPEGGGATSGDPATPLTPAEQQAADLEEYDSLVLELEGQRTEAFGDYATSIQGYGPNLFYLDYGGQWDPDVYVVRPGADPMRITTLSYDDLNYRVSDDILVTAVPDGGLIDYRAFDLDSGAPLGTTTIPSPTSSIAWWAYAADGTDVYLVDEDGGHALTTFVPGDTPQVLTTFAALGVEVAEFWDFDVLGDEMLFIESGRIWLADLALGTAEWLGNDEQASAAAWMDDGSVVYATSGGLFVHVDGSAKDLGALIEGSGYELNSTFAAAHHLTSAEGWSTHGTTVVYMGSNGVFAYDLADASVRPLLLEPNVAGYRVDYRDPVVVDEGTLYVTGLVSTSGAVGSSGPVFRVDGAF